MIMTVEELRMLYPTDENDAVIAARLEAVEQKVRGITNNSFRVRGFCLPVTMHGRAFQTNDIYPLREGDTLQVTGTVRSDGLYTVESVDADGTVHVAQDVPGWETGTAHLVRYPSDVKAGAVDMFRYDMEHREKAGIQSETISRHTVSYVTGADAIGGYPVSLLAFLRPYMRARFGGMA